MGIFVSDFRGRVSSSVSTHTSFQDTFYLVKSKNVEWKNRVKSKQNGNIVEKTFFSNKRKKGKAVYNLILFF